METQGVLIVDTGEITNQSGVPQEPAANIVQPGDYILEVNGKAVSRKRELIAEIENCQGEDVELLVNRKGEKIPLSLAPVLTQEEEYKLGIWVRDNTQGIGTWNQRHRYRPASGCVRRRTVSGPDRLHYPGNPGSAGGTFRLYRI